MFSFPIATSDCRGCCDRCRTQCELCTTCEERPLEEFPDFESARRDVVELMQQWMCSDQEMFPSAAVGQCADGMIVLTYHSGLVGETRFFRSDTEAFVALTNSTDCYEEVCFGRGYWPVRVECDSPIVTEVICGTLYTIGEAIPFF